MSVEDTVEDYKGCLCEFWSFGDDEKTLGKLKNIQEDCLYPYIDEQDHNWKHCRAVKSNEIKIHNDESQQKIHILNEACMKFENENIELVQKVHELEVENEKLKESNYNLMKDLFKYQMNSKPKEWLDK